MVECSFVYIHHLNCQKIFYDAVSHLVWRHLGPISPMSFPSQFEGILPKGPCLPCVSMAGRALLAGYPWIQFTVIPLLALALLQNFTHHTIAELWCLVQKSVVIGNVWCVKRWLTAEWNFEHVWTVEHFFWEMGRGLQRLHRINGFHKKTCNKHV